jgi:glycosyltransferase involved in cell wall biosynthesis
VLKNFADKGDYRLFFITNGGDALDKLKKNGLTPDIMKFSKGLKNLSHVIFNLRLLKKYCIKNNIDIIHTHHRYPEFLSYQISRKINVRTISTVHSLVEGKNKLSFKSDKLIAVSKAVENMLKEKYNIPSEKIITMYNCIKVPDIISEEKQRNLRNKLNIPNEDKIILFLGRISAIKGVDLLIEAFDIVREEFPNISLLIVGQLYDKSMKKILSNLPAKIKLIKPVENPYPFYSISHLVVLPSKMDPFPYVMLESGLMKKPFIGAKTGGIAEFIEDKVNGLLFEPENVMQLAEKIRFMLNNPDEAKSLAENLHAKVKDYTDCEKYYNTLSKVYDNLLLQQ